MTMTRVTNTIVSSFNNSLPLRPTTLLLAFKYCLLQLADFILLQQNIIILLLDTLVWFYCQFDITPGNIVDCNTIV